MKVFTWIVLLSFIVIAIGGRKSSSKYSSKSTSTASPTPSNDELCGCFDIDLMCEPVITNDEICYYYQLNRISDNDYCLDTINYLVLSSGDNLSECGLSDINDITLDYAPKCYDIDTQYSSTNVNGLQFTFNHASTSYQSSDSSSKSSTKGGRRRRRLGGKGSKGSSDKKTSSESSESSAPSTTDTDFVVFSVCFDASYVDGTRDDGMVEINQGNNLFTCDIGSNILPNFCGGVGTETEGSEGNDYHRGIANQEIAHESPHQIEKETSDKINNLSWEIPVGIVVFIGLVIIVGIYYVRTLRARNKQINAVEDDNDNNGTGTGGHKIQFSSAVNNYNIKHLSKLSLSSISAKPKLSTNHLSVDDNIIDDICDPVTPVPCSPDDAWNAMDGFSSSPFDTMESPFGIIDIIENQQQQAPDPEIPNNASPEAIKMQTEINDIYAQIARSSHVGIRHRETF